MLSHEPTDRHRTWLCRVLGTYNVILLLRLHFPPNGTLGNPQPCCLHQLVSSNHLHGDRMAKVLPQAVAALRHTSKLPGVIDV